MSPERYQERVNFRAKFI